MVAKQVHSRASKAKSACEERFVSERKGLRLADAIRSAADEIWPADTAKKFARYVGVSPRCAQQWMAGDTAPGGENLLAILFGEHGAVFLDAFSRAYDRTPGWLARWREEQAAADLIAEIAEREAQLERLRRGRRL